MPAGSIPAEASEPTAEKTPAQPEEGGVPAEVAENAPASEVPQEAAAEVMAEVVPPEATEAQTLPPVEGAQPTLAEEVAAMGEKEAAPETSGLPAEEVPPQAAAGLEVVPEVAE